MQGHIKRGCDMVPTRDTNCHMSCLLPSSEGSKNLIFSDVGVRSHGIGVGRHRRRHTDTDTDRGRDRGRENLADDKTECKLREK